MKKLLLIILSSVFVSSPAFCIDNKENQGNITPVTQIKGSVSDYKSEIINTKWWEKLDDRILNLYIAKALQENKDLKIASLKVEEYKQLVKASIGKEFPTIGIGANLTDQQYSKNYIPIFSGNMSNFTFPLSASYEVDLWGKTKDKVKSENKQLESIAYDEKAALISIASEVASIYVNILKTNQDIEFQNEIINLKNEKLNLIQTKYNVGVCAYDQVLVTEKELADSNTVLNDYKKSLEILKNSLAIFTGDSPENISEMKFGNIYSLNTDFNTEYKIPSEKILKRPDILKAEALLKKSKIDVNIARKEFLPDLTLTGQTGFNSSSFEKIFTGNSFTYGFGANIAETVFKGGQRRAMLKSKKYLYDQMLENYSKTLLVSLKEVNNSLISVKTGYKNNEEIIKKLKFEKENLKLINEKYKAGIISYLDTLEPKEKLILIKRAQLQTKTGYIIDNFSLYRALGANI